MRPHPFDGCPLEPLRLVLEIAGQPAPSVNHLERDIDLTFLLSEKIGLCVQEQSGQIHRAMRLQFERRLENRRLTALPHDAEALDEIRERIGVVSDALHDRLAHAAQEVGEARVAGKIPANHDGVHEIADGGVEFRGTPGRGCADQNLDPAGMPREQHLKRCHQNGEKRGSLILRDSLEAARQAFGQLERDRPAAFLGAGQPRRSPGSSSGAGRSCSCRSQYSFSLCPSGPSSISRCLRTKSM